MLLLAHNFFDSRRFVVDFLAATTARGGVSINKKEYRQNAARVHAPSMEKEISQLDIIFFFYPSTIVEFPNFSILFAACTTFS